MKRKKKIISKISLAIGVICSLFCVMVVPIFAIQTGREYYSNVFSGQQSYAFIPITSCKYVAYSESSRNVYWKDIPFSNVYNVSGLTNFVGIKQPLDANSSPVQNIYTNEVAQGVINPDLVYEGVSFDVNNYDAVYDEYKVDGQIDCLYTSITSRGTTDALPHYQSVILKLADFNTTKTMRGIVDNKPVLTYYAPSVVFYQGNTEQDTVYTISGTVSCKYDGQDIQQYFEYTQAERATEMQGGFAVGEISPYTVVYNRLRQYEWFLDANVVTFGGMTIELGNVNDGLLTQIRNSMPAPLIEGCAVGYAIRQPMLRPYRKLDSYNVAFSPESNDINYKIGTLNYDSSNISPEDGLGITRVGEFVADAVSGFFELSLFPGFTVGGIFFTVFAIMLTLAILKYFAGG